MTWAISDALALSQLQATLGRLAAAPGPATVLIYSSPMPAEADPLAVAPDAQVTIPLAATPGSIVAGVLKLAQQADPQPMAAASGVPRWGLLVAGDGVPLARGDVTDSAHTGAIRITGGTTAPGETAPMLYAGGLVALAETYLT